MEKQKIEKLWAMLANKRSLDLDRQSEMLAALFDAGKIRFAKDQNQQEKNNENQHSQSGHQSGFGQAD